MNENVVAAACTVAGALLTLGIVFKVFKGEELKEAEKARAVVGVVGAVAPWIVKRG
jgi:hypothetical protein